MAPANVSAQRASLFRDRRSTCSSSCCVLYVRPACVQRARALGGQGSSSYDSGTDAVAISDGDQTRSLLFVMVRLALHCLNRRLSPSVLDRLRTLHGYVMLTPQLSQRYRLIPSPPVGESRGANISHSTPTHRLRWFWRSHRRMHALWSH